MMTEEKNAKPRPVSGQYRSDIDGLRAIAVGSVIMFHLNHALLQGGFVGVDVFFVISGYLITLHMLRDVDRGVFSIAEFYRHRVKRIMPAMLLVIAVVIVASMILQRPSDTDELARSAIASVPFLANVYFWLFQNPSYFAQASAETPLLHLWSLGVEGQFYLFWPLLLMALYPRLGSARLMAVLAVIAAGSFGLAEWLYLYSSSFVYYMLPTRAGELLIGALAAFWIFRHGQASLPAWVVQVLAWSGLAAVLLSLLFVSETGVFPGLAAIPATLGSAALIVAGHFGDSLPTRVLRRQPLVFIGLISYSAYLWHWPLLAFLRYAGQPIDLFNGAVVVVATLILATATYYWVETPARRYRGTAAQVVWRQFVIPGGLVLAFCSILVITRGYFLHNNAQQLENLASRSLPAYRFDSVCQSWRIQPQDVANPACVLGKPDDATPRVLLWGDSHAAQYVGMLAAFADHAGFRFRNLAHSSCPPLNVDPKPFVLAKNLNNCRASLKIMASVVNDFDVIVISADWADYLNARAPFWPVFSDMVRALVGQGKRVILLGKVPRIDAYDRVCMEKAASLSWMNCHYQDNPLAPGVVELNRQLQDFAQHQAGVGYFDVTEAVCSARQAGGPAVCSAYDAEGNALYFSPNYLSMSGSQRLAEKRIAGGGMPAVFATLGSAPKRR